MRTNYKKSDPKAPRFRREETDLLNAGNKEFFADMKKRHPELAKYGNGDIAKCIKLCNVALANQVVHNRNGIKLPEGLGVVIAGACKVPDKTAEKNINVEVRNKTGIEVPHSNIHSDGYVAKVKYSSEVDKYMFPNHDFWVFDPGRPLSRALSAEFKKGNHLNYIVFSTYTHISHLFRPDKIRKEDAKAVERKKEKLDNYDEFAFN